jgi:GNAT superfamily N-acetyltransferase
MQIRKATIEDENHIVNLLRQFPPEEATIDWEIGAQTFRRIVENSDLGTIFLAEENGQALGVITLSYPHAIRCGGDYSCIEEFIVDERGRGKGVGGQLLKAAIAEAQSRGCYELQVNRPSELGYPVYLRYGWRDLGKHLNLRLND